MAQFYEQLPPDEFESLLFIRISHLEQLLSIKNNALKKAPEGNLRITRCKGTAQYYHLQRGETNGTYIPKGRMEFIKSLAQKDYNKRLLPVLTREISFLRKIALELKTNPLSAVLEDLSPDRQSLIETPTLSDTEFVKRWLSVEYEKKFFPQDGPEYFTATGKRVRSKSEIIIADTLDRLNIPYRYEFPVKVGEVLLHPDFFCLNTITRQEFAWEHLGMMDDCDYSVKAVQKLHLYQKKKWLPGKTMIITMETRESPINSRQVEEVARAYCLTPLFPNRG